MANYKIIHAKKDLKDLVLDKYVNIAFPDTYDGALYKFSSTFSGAVADRLVAVIDSNLIESAAEIGAKPSPLKRPYKRHEDGSVTFTFKIKQFKEGERPFKLWDMSMNAITDVPNLTDGSILNVNFAFYISQYKGTAFIAMQPTHCQVKHIEEYTGSPASEPTFGEGEGYEAPAGSPSFGHAGQDVPPPADDDF